MSIQSHQSPNGALGGLDGIAASATDLWLLIGRVTLGWIFLASGWTKLLGIGGFVGYLTNLKVPAPEISAWVGAIVEFLVGATLVLGLATRYGAALGIIFVIMATALAHRYWEYPAAQVMAQYNNFLKNLAILGGMFYAFVFGPGRFSVDNMLGKK
jgi:putative oxidoreductase